MKSALFHLVAGSLLTSSALAADWKSYSYPDAGFAVQFPGEPTVDKSAFKSGAGTSLPMTRYTLNQDHVLYSLSVVDYAPSANGTALIAEAEKSFGATGKVTVAIDARVNRSFGRELSVTGHDGSRSAIALFFVNGHLFTLVGQALPPNAIEHSGDATRFQESLNFLGANGGFGGRFRGGFNPQAQAACVGKSAGDAVQLETPGGTVAATCTLLARPNMPPPGAPGPGRPPGPPDGEGRPAAPAP